MESKKKLISIVIPVHNEELDVPLVYKEIDQTFHSLPYLYEIIFVNDGSSDGSQKVIEYLAKNHSDKIKYIEFSRNFGKELATTAGFNMALGDAAMAIDCDLQHPPECIPEFLKKWQDGADVVVGLRQESKSDGFIKKQGSKWFYRILKMISETETIPQSTDFRLIDRVVLDEFNKISEHDRITRGLIDWLGFRREYVFFEARDRRNGEASYNLIKLFRLAVTSFITHSLFPLRFAGYAGLVIMLLSGILGIVEFIDRYVGSIKLHFSGPAILATVTLFLVGLILACLGLMAVYIGNIYHNTRHRPLYVIRSKKI